MPLTSQYPSKTNDQRLNFSLRVNQPMCFRPKIGVYLVIASTMDIEFPFPFPFPETLQPKQNNRRKYNRNSDMPSRARTTYSHNMWEFVNLETCQWDCKHFVGLLEYCGTWLRLCGYMCETCGKVAQISIRIGRGCEIWGDRAELHGVICSLAE